MSLAEHVGRAQTITDAEGRKWHLSRWTRSVWAKMLEWARPRIPDPLEVAKRMMAMLPEEQQERVLSAALPMGCEPLHIGSRSVTIMVDSLEGTAHLTWLLMLDAHPDASEDLAFDIVLGIGLEALRKTLKKTEGEPPPQQPGKESAPAAS